jgi:cell division protein FtsW (lipid II flippase)
MVIYIAYFLKKKKKDVADLRDGFIPFLAIVGVALVLLALQPDF